MTDISYVLLLVVLSVLALFCCWQPDGTPSMPELTWRYGYLGFWILSIVVTVLLVGYFRYVKRWL